MTWYPAPTPWLREPDEQSLTDTLGYSLSPHSVAVSAGRRIVAVPGYRTIELRDLETKTPLLTIEASAKMVSRAALSSDGSLVASEEEVWDTRTGEPVAELRLATFSPDGALIAVRTDNGVALLRVTDLSVVKELTIELPVHGGPRTFSPDSAVLAIAQGPEILLWQYDLAEPPTVLCGPTQQVKQVAFGPDGRKIAARTVGEYVHIWCDAAEPPPRYEPPHWENVIEPVAAKEIPYRTADEFLAAIKTMSWFGRVGQPSPWDDKCKRLTSWEDETWEGPESNEGAGLDDHFSDMHELVSMAARTYGAKLAELSDKVGDATYVAAAEYVPFNDESDHYNPPNNAVCIAAYIARLVACFLELGWQIPSDLAEVWAWLEAGHWPAGFWSTNPEGEPPVQLMVF